MRLLCKIKLTEDPLPLLTQLHHEGIGYQCEQVPSDGHYYVWILSEEDLVKATHLWSSMDIVEPQAGTCLPSVALLKKKRHSFGPLTFLILAFCSVILLYHAMTPKPPVMALSGIWPAPSLTHVEEALLFDFPTYFILRQELAPLVSSNGTIEPPGPILLHRMQALPVWMGIYPLMVPSPGLTSSFSGFGERIRSGELWRLWTPVLLHADLLHLFFNATWIWLFGHMIEKRLGTLRYGLLLLSIGVTSNMAQYGVTGPFFMGLSGIVCGLAAFIWVRQRRAPWEGYPIPSIALSFLFIFVAGMVMLEGISMTLTLWKGFSLPVTIANTAHVTGLIVGGLLALPMQLFQCRRTR